MPRQTTTIEVASQFGVSIPNSFIYHEMPSSTRLMVLLPGRGYTCDKPLLHYMQSMALQHGFDVLRVQYGFQVANGDLTAETASYLQEDVKKATDQVYPRGYSHICIVGKSLGTPLAAELARNTTTDQISLILLTPIGGAVQGLNGIRTLAVIGTQDPLYSPEVIKAFKHIPDVNWEVFDNLNHSLEIEDDWRGSIGVLPRIIETCESFLLAKA